LVSLLFGIFLEGSRKTAKSLDIIGRRPQHRIRYLSSARKPVVTLLR
jgi:hypothetical protein